VKPLAQIALELGIHLETLRGWRRGYGNATEAPEAATGVVPSLEEENRRLRRENERLREEREILTKATASFAKDAG
jgi:transposase